METNQIIKGWTRVITYMFCGRSDLVCRSFYFTDSDNTQSAGEILRGLGTESESGEIANILF